MTRNSAIKSTVRARMERTGQSYAEALRDVRGGRTPIRTPLPAAGYTIQMDRLSTGALPYPAFLSRDGYLFNSVLEYGWVIGFEVADSPTRSIALTWQDFAAHPEKAVGMVPVTRDPFTDIWSSWTTPVVSLDVLPQAPEMDEGRWARVEEMHARHIIDDPIEFTLSNGQRWEVTGNGLLEDLSEEAGRPFAALGEFRLPAGDVLGWGAFVEDPQRAIGAALVLWTTEGERRLPDFESVTEVVQR